MITNKESKIMKKKITSAMYDIDKIEDLIDETVSDHLSEINRAENHINKALKRLESYNVDQSYYNLACDPWKGYMDSIMDYEHNNPGLGWCDDDEDIQADVCIIKQDKAVVSKDLKQIHKDLKQITRNQKPLKQLKLATK